MRLSALSALPVAMSILASPLVSAEDPVLVRVTTRTAKAYAGELVAEDAAAITFVDLVTNREVKLPKSDVLKLTKPATLDEATQTAGLPAVTAWKLAQLAGAKPPAGKVARVTAQVVYTTIGGKQGAQVGQELTVYRVKEEIKDPDTGKVIAVERPRIAALKVVEVSDEYCKARVLGDLEVMLEAGDEVELAAKAMRVAVCPIYHEDGSLTNVGAKLGEDVTTLLVQREVPVVERTVLNTVLPELLAQKTVLFDQQGAQKLGKLAGATVVVTGKIVPEQRTGTAYLRMVDVETGAILFAASDSISLTRARVVGGSSSGGVPGTNPRTSPTPRRAGAAVKLTDDAPNDWVLQPARRGGQLWSGARYVFSIMPDDIAGGTVLVRGQGNNDQWLPEGLTALRNTTVYAIIRWKYLGKTEFDDVKFAQFERDGWEKTDLPVQTTFPAGEDWRWAALKMEIPEGDVLLTLKTANWKRVPVVFVFK